MENSSNSPNAPKNQVGEGSVVRHSEFLRRLSSLPVVNAMLVFTLNIYAKAKSSFTIVSKASDWVEYSARVVAAYASPFVNQLSPLAASPLAKVDDLATKGLVTLEQKLPAIKKQPNEIVSDTREMISSRVTPAVERLSNASEHVLGNKLVQFPCDMIEKLLSNGSAMVNNVLPSEKTTQNGQQQSNGFPVEKKPENKAQRVGWLVKESFFFAWNTSQKLYGYVQSKTGTHGGSDAVVRKSL